MPPIMEVHHHAHTSRKKWTHYVWEFLMLFLAVFCGFIAENIREGYIENHRGKQYVEFLLRDLKKDTANINSTIKDNIALVANYDSLWVHLTNYSASKGARDLYEYFRKSLYYSTFLHTTRAIDQLQNAGQLRLVKNINLADTISAYYEHAKSVEEQGNVYMKYFHDFHEQALKVFEYDQFMNFKLGEMYERNKPYTLVIDDPNVLKELCSKVILARFILTDYIRNVREQKKNGLSTIEYLEKVYSH
jgi:hypothetical protein